MEVVQSLTEKEKIIGIFEYKDDINSIQFVKLNNFLSPIGIIKPEGSKTFLGPEGSKKALQLLNKSNKNFNFIYCMDGFNITRKYTTFSVVLHDIQTGYLNNFEYLLNRIGISSQVKEINPYIKVLDLRSKNPNIYGVHNEHYCKLPFYGLQGGLLCYGEVICYKNGYDSYHRFHLFNNMEELISNAVLLTKSYVRLVYPESAEVYDAAKILVSMKNS